MGNIEHCYYLLTSISAANFDVMSLNVVILNPVKTYPRKTAGQCHSVVVWLRH